MLAETLTECSISRTNQQFRKDVYNIIIQQSFLDGNVVFEADIDLVKIFLKTVRIMEIDHRIPAVHDCFKIAAGIGTVKMQPFCIPSSGGIVAVRFIAVQQDNLVRPGMTDPPPVSISQLPFCMYIIRKLS